MSAMLLDLQHRGDMASGYHWRWVLLEETGKGVFSVVMFDDSCKTRRAARKAALAFMRNAGGTYAGEWGERPITVNV